VHELQLNIVLYTHILAACAWIGGSIVLFGLGVFIRDKQTQEAVYGAIGPFYGYFETVWLIILIGTGLMLANHYNLFALLDDENTEIAYWIQMKIVLVSGIAFATVVHLFIAFRTHKKSRTLLQKVVSRGGSLAIFLLNLSIIWVAMHIRSIL